MKIQPSLSALTTQNNNTNFKSVYPVYHWYNYNSTKFSPVTDLDVANKCQRALVAIANSIVPNFDRKENTFIQKVVNYLATFDKDYKTVPYVRSFYNPHGGFKYDYKGNLYKIEPLVYLLTGNDAIDFENKYGIPINAVKNQEYRAPSNMKEAVRNAKRAYYYSGYDFTKRKSRHLKDTESGKPMELHTICQKGNKKHPQLIKIQFFEGNSADNPFVKNGYII